MSVYIPARPEPDRTALVEMTFREGGGKKRWRERWREGRKEGREKTKEEERRRRH